ncbi:DUF2489 domain-containing protein [Spongiibacter sp.]|uniref:DUF2489 domain-containing protein n=1 Tax=Spongiibacter sp. TaxID=2024860 RepID=UPI00356377C2
MEQYWPWIVAAAVIVVALAGYAARLLWRLRALNAQRAASGAAAVEAVEQFEPAPSQHRLGVHESIRVLARCYLDGQLGGSELCLRLAVLLDQPAVDEALRQQGEVFIELAAKLAEVPTHQAWKNLSRSERNKFRQHMDQLESDHAEAMRAAARRLAG